MKYNFVKGQQKGPNFCLDRQRLLKLLPKIINLKQLLHLKFFSISEWLQSRGSRRDFEHLDSVSLANVLEEFYENLTKPDGEEYSVSTMHTIRASISRYLSLPPQSKPFSIIRDREFKKANEAFYRRIRRLQSPRQPAFHYAPGQTAIWQPHPSTVNIPCNSNGIMLVQLGPPPTQQ